MMLRLQPPPLLWLFGAGRAATRGRGGLGVRRVSGGPVKLTVTPSKSLADEPLAIQAEGLGAEQAVTLRAQVVTEQGQLFASCGQYRADGGGRLALDQSPSLGGDYEGVAPMGLLWTLAPAPMEQPYLKLSQAHLTGSPMYIDLCVHSGHSGKNTIPGQPLAKQRVERWYSKPGLRRIRLREGNIRGSIFIPPGSGPFPGVISVNEIKGGLFEYRSSLLANHGFTTLALAYHNYDDLPKGVINLDLGYFEEAVHFLKQHPKVKGLGVGAIGISKGADLVLSMAAFLPDVRAAVVINGCITSAEFGLCFKNKLISTGLRHTVSRMKIADSGVADVSEVINEVDKDSIIPIENTKGTILFIAGEEDKNWNSKHYVDEAVKRLKEHGNDRFEVLCYRGSGHYLEPPFFPFCYASHHSVLNICTKWGGNAKDHSSAQVESWQKIQAFFRKILRQ